jgi:hypothetical protein
MATDIAGLFGLTPESYQMAQDQAAQAQAMKYAEMDPFQRANYGMFLGGKQLGGAIGSALGAQDPMLQQISQQQSLLKSIDFSNLDSIKQAIPQASAINPQLAAALLAKYQEGQKSQAEVFKATREAQTPEQRNAATLAAMEAAPGTPEYAAALKKNMERLTNKTPTSLLEAQAVADAEDAVRQTTPGSPEHTRATATLRALKIGKLQTIEIGLPNNPEMVQKVMVDPFDPQAKPMPIGAPYSRFTSKVSATATTGENQYGSTFGGGVAKDDLALRASAQKAPEMLAAADATEKLLQSNNVITGAGANAKLNVLAFGQALGATGRTTDELIANTQQLQQQRSTAVLSQVKSSGLGTGQGFTDKDLKFLQDSAAGNINLSKETIQRQVEVERKVARALTAQWNKRLGEMPQQVVKPMGLSPVDLPASTSFSSVEEALAAKLPKGTQITVNGRKAIVE